MTDQDPTQQYTPPPEPTPAEPPAEPEPTPTPTSVQPVGAPTPAAAAPTPAASSPTPATDPAPDATAPYTPPAPPPPAAPVAQPASGAVPTFLPPQATGDAVATAPVVAAAAPAKRRSPLKWIVALVVIALVAASAAAGAVLLTGASGTPSVLAWTPADSVTYAEVRLDLPGNQQAELAKVLSAFPGFDDQAAFPTKINEVLDQVVGKASDGKQSYTADIQPWFGGQLSVSIGALPSGADTASARFLALASVKDAAKATSWAASTLQETGATSTTETYNGVTITVIKPPADVSVMAEKVQIAYAVTGPVLALGDLASVKAAIDTGGKTGLNTNAQFKTASATITGDRLAFAYVDTEAIVDAAAAMVPGDGMPTAALSFFDGLYPSWSVVAVEAQNGALVVESRQPHNEKLGAAPNAASTLPSLVPADTVALVDTQDFGGALKRLKAMLASDPSLKDGVQQVDDALKLIGGFDAAVGWMGESGIAITNTNGEIAGGIVVVPTSAADANRLFTQLRGFIELAAGGSGVTLTDETYNGATITSVDLSGIGALAGAATGVDVPGGIKLAYSVTDKVVVFGTSVDFVKGVLDAPSGSNLASTDQFKSALARVDSVNSMLFWLDIAGIRSFAEARLSSDDKSSYEADLKPYLDAFDSVIATNVSGDVDEGTLVLSVTGN